jgi:hypothetical protein
MRRAVINVMHPADVYRPLTTARNFNNLTRMGQRYATAISV